MYCNFHIAQIIIIEDIDNITKGALEVFFSVFVSIRFARKAFISQQTDIIHGLYI